MRRHNKRCPVASREKPDNLPEEKRNHSCMPSVQGLPENLFIREVWLALNYRPVIPQGTVKDAC